MFVVEMILEKVSIGEPLSDHKIVHDGCRNIVAVVVVVNSSLVECIFFQRQIDSRNVFVSYDSERYAVQNKRHFS